MAASPFTNFLRLKYLIPSFGTNEKSNPDRVQIQIYSDAYSHMLQCGLFFI